jgi:GNAT superfamily N-acetyltransferase
MALVRPDDETPGEAVLNALWVAPEARGRGNAQALCEACARWAAARGFCALRTAVVLGNEPARKTYESTGFVFERTDTWTGHGRTLEEIVLRRPLALDR